MEQNERLARGLVLLSPQFMDWGVTACFYAALHLVDGYLARLGIHPNNHAERENWIRRQLRPIYGTYRRLKQLSMRARYDAFQMNSATAFQPALSKTLFPQNWKLSGIISPGFFRNHSDSLHISFLS